MIPSAVALWEEPLPPEERDTLISRVADAVVRRGLQTTVLLALEIHRPLAFTLSQGMIVATPLLGPLLGLEAMQKMGRLLRDPEAYEALVEALSSTDTVARSEGSH